MKIQTFLLASSILLTPMMSQAKPLSVSSNANTTTQNINIPKRFSTMKSVLKHYGKAKRVTRSRGRPTKKWPRITRWEYGRFTVYFEKHIVLHTVMN
ncbi:MAG TPA: hypothetical protein ENJ51_01900 [Leucothrix mucor]|uniref:Uncharacterized protein n=1 Tax=Leucothrix mucor TaxID=45248 RepID=A0A7V2SY29_LEUMU|nr:hypothetical protein [Leucothrix mucor]